MTDRDIDDEIAALVDSQLKQERSGYDDKINQAKCPRCERRWHGLPLTERVAIMYELGYFDVTYVAAMDDSPIVCDGPHFIGPLRPPTEAIAGFDLARRDVPRGGKRAVVDYIEDALVVMLGMWPALMWPAQGVAALLIFRLRRRRRRRRATSSAASRG
jgi:hypothetical protein